MKNTTAKKSKKVSERAVRPKKITVKDQVIILLTERNDLTMEKLAETLGKSYVYIAVTLGHLRKEGFKIWPSKGPGTPLKIARSMSDAVKFIEWRRARFLDTTRNMIIAETELGEQYAELKGKHEELLKLIKEKNYELSTGSDIKPKTGSKSA